MTEIVDELRATRPHATDALRVEILALTSQPPVRPPSLFDRLRTRRLLLVVPAAAGLALALGGCDRHLAAGVGSRGRGEPETGERLRDRHEPGRGRDERGRDRRRPLGAQGAELPAGTRGRPERRQAAALQRRPRSSRCATPTRSRTPRRRRSRSSARSAATRSRRRSGPPARREPHRSSCVSRPRRRQDALVASLRARHDRRAAGSDRRSRRSGLGLAKRELERYVSRSHASPRGRTPMSSSRAGDARARAGQLRARAARTVGRRPPR